MFKSIWGTRFREGIDRDEARAYWTNAHGPLGAKVPTVSVYIQSHLVAAIRPDGVEEGELAIDGYASEWWADRAAFDIGMRSPEWKTLVEDDANVFAEDSGDGLCASVEERLLRESERAPFKVVWFVRFREDLPREEADDHWLNRHAALVLAVPGLSRYVQNLVLGSLGPFGVEGAPIAYDGLSECWFPDRQTFVGATKSSAWQRLVEDGYRFLDMDALAGMCGIVEERIIKS